MKITVKVTAADIKHGKRCVSHLCPIARALKRVRPAGYKRATAMVLPGLAALYNAYSSPEASKPITGSLPAPAQRFINHFDTGKKVKPFKFTIKFK